MDKTDIFATDDMERFRAWLGSVLVPALVHMRYCEAMGLDSAFVRRFYRRHRRVLRFDGTIARNVRGINELELLRGVADVFGVRPFEDDWDPRDTVTTIAVAQGCLDVLAQMEGDQGPETWAV